jgi:hypothetical protein
MIATAIIALIAVFGLRRIAHSPALEATPETVRPVTKLSAVTN